MVTFYMDKGTHSANNFINLYELLWGKGMNVVRWVLHITTSRISICQMDDSMKMIYALSAKVSSIPRQKEWKKIIRIANY